MIESATTVRRTRRQATLVVYLALGPLASLVLAAKAGALGHPAIWTLVIFQVVVAGVVFAILRPRSYRRSTWRALCAALVLVGPSLLMASSLMPIFELLDPTPGSVGLDLASPHVWAAFWLAVGLLGCSVAALVSAVGSVVSAGPVSEGSPTAARGKRPFQPRARDYVRLAVVAFTLLIVTIGTLGIYYLLSFPFALAKSHIDGNVPDGTRFDAYLERDLTAYFRADDSTVTTVDYDLLRRGPTQVGIAYPKYYAWVTVTRTKGPSQEGAVRLAAVDKLRFVVTDFLPRETVLSSPEIVRERFPAALNEQIMRRARVTR
jgi:hypothetical protein